MGAFDLSINARRVVPCNLSHVSSPALAGCFQVWPDSMPSHSSTFLAARPLPSAPTSQGVDGDTGPEGPSVLHIESDPLWVRATGVWLKDLPGIRYVGSVSRGHDGIIENDFHEKGVTGDALTEAQHTLTECILVQRLFNLARSSPRNEFEVHFNE